MLQHNSNMWSRRLFLISESSTWHDYTAALRYAGWEQYVRSSGEDDLYLSFKSVPSCTSDSCGWQPEVTLIVVDSVGVVFSSASADVSGKPTELILHPKYVAPA